MPLEGRRSFYGPGSDTMHIIDHRTGERRKPVLNDVREGMILCDALPRIDFVMSLVLSGDVDQTIADTLQMEVMLNNTIKPIIAVTYDLPGLVDAVEMAEMEAGLVEWLVQIGIHTQAGHTREQTRKSGVEVVEMKDWRDDRCKNIQGNFSNDVGKVKHANRR